MEKTKKPWKLVPVWAAIIAVAVSFVSLFLHWFTLDDRGQSAMEAIRADPDFFTGALPVLLIAMVWIIAFFLLNHPKLTLIGDAALLFMFAAFTLAGSDRGLHPGIGSYLFLLAVIVCILCAFLTRKQKKAKPARDAAGQ